MSKEYVIISIDRYNELMDVERKFKEPRKHTILIQQNISCRTTISTDDEAVNKIALELKEKQDKIDELNKSIDKISKMSIVEFAVWENKK